MIGALLAYLRDGFQIMDIEENCFAMKSSLYWKLQRATLRGGVEQKFVRLPEGWVRSQ